MVVLAGYGTYLALKQFQLHPHPGPLVGTAVAYFLVAFFLLRGTAMVWRGVTGVPRVLIVGTGSEAQGVLSDLRADDRHMREVVGFFPTALDDETLVDGAPIFDRARPLTDIVSTYGIDEIVVAAREQRGGVMPMDQLLTCRTRGIKILDLAAFYERSHAEVPVDSLKASWLVYGDGFVQGPARRLAKRAFDVVSSAFLLVVASPVMLLAALAIKLDSRGPVFYRQERVGLGGRLLPVREVPQHGHRRRKRWRCALGHQERFARHASGCVPAQDAHRRVASAVQRAQGRNEHRRPASRTARVRGQAERARFRSTTCATVSSLV